MINRNNSFIEERRNLICDTLHTTGITCEQVIEGIMWKQATNGIPRPRQRNWRKSSVAITNSIRILVFFLSLSPSLSFSRQPTEIFHRTTRSRVPFLDGSIADGASLYCFAHDHSNRAISSTESHVDRPWLTKSFIIYDPRPVAGDRPIFVQFIRIARGGVERNLSLSIWKKKEKKERKKIHSLLGK